MSYSILRKKRITVSRFVSAFLISVCIFTRTEINSHVAEFLLDNVGLVFIVAGVFGRIWASMYICGYKKTELITLGPYAVVRNPLYLFSFVGVVGVVLSSQNYLFMGLTVLFFLIYYPFVVIGEEQQLYLRHNDSFNEYAQKTPRFIPNLNDIFTCSQPKKYEVNVDRFSKVYFDAIWFFIAYILMDVVKFLHSKDLLPVILKL